MCKNIFWMNTIFFSKPLNECLDFNAMHLEQMGYWFEGNKKNKNKKASFYTLYKNNYKGEFFK